MTTATQTTGTDGFVQTPPDGGGKSIATTIVTRDDTTTTVHRQETILTDPLSSDAKGAVKTSATGAEYGPVVWLAPSPQLQEMINLATKQLDALNQIIVLLGGMPAA